MVTEKDKKAFEHLQKSLERIRTRTERDVQAAVHKFTRTASKDSELALAPPTFYFKMPKLYSLQNKVIAE